MSDPLEKEYLESLVNYYRVKTVQLEYDFVAYKIKTEQKFRELNNNIENLLSLVEKEKKPKK
jgi:hypothetical protein